MTFFEMRDLCDTFGTIKSHAVSIIILFILSSQKKNRWAIKANAQSGNQSKNKMKHSSRWCTDDPPVMFTKTTVTIFFRRRKNHENR